MYPVAFVTTVQPWMLAWALTTSAFLTMSIIALWSRGKTVRQVVAGSLIAYPLVVLATCVVATVGTGWSIIDVEVIRVIPRTIEHD